MVTPFALSWSKFNPSFMRLILLSLLLRYTDEESLHDILQHSGPIEPNLASSYIHHVHHGLHFLHSCSVIHFNLQAANILVGRGGNVKLTDFGVPFNWIQNQAGSKEVVGRANWMAPEVILLEAPTQKSDIWSLGCTVIEIVMGGPPYDHIMNSLFGVYPLLSDLLMTGSAVMFRIVEDSIPPIPPKCSGPMRIFLEQCLQQEPQERPSAGALLSHPWIKVG